MKTPGLPAGHRDRLERARLSLEGLSIGDAFGGRFFAPPGRDRVTPPPVWRYSDDTEMALSIVEILERHGRVDQEQLAGSFARRYQADPHRGYGLSVRRVLEGIAGGDSWHDSTRSIFSGVGSMGNGGAMRVAPLGAYFADDIDQVVGQARASAQVTHAHAEGQAGAIATAVAAAWAWNSRSQRTPRSGRGMLDLVIDRTPDGEVRTGLVRAVSLGFDVPVEEAATVLGNGSRITAPDTVPFALWCAARHIDNYAEALWTAVSVGGDNDTNCAIVGGIVVLACGPEAIPEGWLAAREPLEWGDGVSCPGNDSAGEPDPGRRGGR
jgi:ADP-ribosylglycohydrolase